MLRNDLRLRYYIFIEILLELDLIMKIIIVFIVIFKKVFCYYMCNVCSKKVKRKGNV